MISGSDGRDQCLASVVVPAYNGEDHIGRCLNSLCEQTLDDIEIIVVDDGSKDNTRQVAESVLSSSGRSYKIVSQSNQGVSVARNRGLEMSSGKYVLFLDCDDYLHPSCLSKVVDMAESTGSEIVFCGYDYVSETGEIVRAYTSRYRYLDGPTPGPEVLVSVFLENVSVWTGNTIYRKGFLDMYNLRYTKGRILAQDVEFEFKALFHARSVSSVNEVLSFYLQRPSSVTSTVSLPKRFIGIDVLFAVREHFTQWICQHTPSGSALAYEVEDVSVGEADLLGDSGSLDCSLRGDSNLDLLPLQVQALEYLDKYMIPLGLAGVFGSLSSEGYPKRELKKILEDRPEFVEALGKFERIPEANLSFRRALQVRLLQHFPYVYFIVCRIVGIIRGL